MIPATRFRNLQMKSKAAFRDTVTGMDSFRDDGQPDILPATQRDALSCTRTGFWRASCARIAAGGLRGVVEILTDRRNPSLVGCCKRVASGSSHPRTSAGTGHPDPGQRRRRPSQGQVVVVELTEPPALFGQPVVASPRCWGGGRPWHGNSKLRFASTACP